MAASSRRVLLEGALTDSANGDIKSFGPRDKEFVFSLVATGVHADTTVNAKVQHTPDAGTTWIDLAGVSFTALVGVNGAELKFPSTSVLGQLRGVVTLTGTTKAATVALTAHHA